MSASQRTYGRDTYIAARDAWDSGSFGPEWDDVRRLSWERGFPFPPLGSGGDDPDTEDPSQRAVVWQWLDARPQEVREIVGRSRSWGEVIDRLIGMRKRLQADADLSDREAEWERAERPTYHEAVSSIATIVGRIADSRP